MKNNWTTTRTHWPQMTFATVLYCSPHFRSCTAADSNLRLKSCRTARPTGSRVRVTFGHEKLVRFTHHVWWWPEALMHGWGYGGDRRRTGGKPHDGVRGQDYGFWEFDCRLLSATHNLLLSTNSTRTCAAREPTQTRSAEEVVFQMC